MISSIVSVTLGIRVDRVETEPRDIVEIPLGRLGGALRACPGSGLVDLVVDVGDVVDELHRVAVGAEPAGHPREHDERTRVADVRTLIDGRPADVHPDLGRRCGKLDEVTRKRVVEPHRAMVPSLAFASRDAEAPERLLSGEVGKHRPELGPALDAGQRAPHRLQVAPDRLQLAQELARAGARRAGSGLRCTELREALERRSGLLAERDEHRLEHLLGDLAHLDERARPTERTCQPDGARRRSPPAPRRASPRSRRSRAGRVGPRRATRRAQEGRARRGRRALPPRGPPPRAARRPRCARAASRASSRRRRGGDRGGRPRAVRPRGRVRFPAAAPRSAGDRSRG